MDVLFRQDRWLSLFRRWHEIAPLSADFGISQNIEVSDPPWNSHNRHVWSRSVPRNFSSSCVPKHCQVSEVASMGTHIDDISCSVILVVGWASRDDILLDVIGVIDNFARTIRQHISRQSSRVTHIRMSPILLPAFPAVKASQKFWNSSDPTAIISTYHTLLPYLWDPSSSPASSLPVSPVQYWRRTVR